jgi:serine phosphatase RsbU (regulator of sigma subunit)
VVCTLNISSNRLLYASVNSPFFHFRSGEITEIKPNNLRGGWSENSDCDFDCGNIHLRAGDILYFCSDGFADQFGGKSHKKYQKIRFMNLLKDISGYPMPEQSDQLNEEIEDWREENKEDQTDDIMVIGIKI